MKSGILAVIWIASAALFPACREGAEKKIEQAAVHFETEGELSLYSAPSDSLLGTLDIEIADTAYETETGLMYRDELKENQGMLFIFKESGLHSFYMKNTRIPLDLLFLDENKTLVHIKENAQPLDESGISSTLPIQYVLEVNAGLAAKWGLQTGDRMTFIKK